MTDMTAEDALHEECCEAIAKHNLDVRCADLERLLEQARAVAVHLEGELAEVRRIARMAYWTHGGEMTHNEAHDALARWSSSRSDEGLALAERLAEK